MFSPGTNPADKGMPYLNQIPGELKQYYDPYIGYGKSAYDTMNPQLSQMTTDPAAYMDKLMASYEPSKAYQLQKDEMTKAAGNTAAAGGMRGSLSDITGEARITDTLMGNDMQRWLDNALGIQRTGLQGEGNIFSTGYQASSSLADNLSNVLGSQAQLAFQGQREQNQDKNDLMKSLLGMGGGAANWLFGGTGQGGQGSSNFMSGIGDIASIGSMFL